MRHIGMKWGTQLGLVAAIAILLIGVVRVEGDPPSDLSAKGGSIDQDGNVADADSVTADTADPDTGIVSKTFRPPGSWSFRIFKDQEKKPGAIYPQHERIDLILSTGWTLQQGFSEADSAINVPVKTTAWETADSWPITADGNLKGGSGGPGGQGGETPHWAAKMAELSIVYMGSKSATNAAEETKKPLTGEYFMHRYVLELSCPPPKAGTDVTWEIKQGGAETGKFLPSLNWEDYESPLATKPKAAVVYWRADADDSFPGTFTVTAKVTPVGAANQITLSRTIKTRELNPDVADHSTKFNCDADMVQRALIQIFALDKGRLDRFDLGQYQRNGGTPKFYHSNASFRNIKDWSKVADEMWNVDAFVIGTPAGNRTDTAKERHFDAIWGEFKMILDAGAIGEVTTTHANFAAWQAAAANHLTSIPAAFPKGAGDCIEALLKTESNSATHSYNKFAPLAVNNVRIGEAVSTSGGQHAYTDFGIGWGAVQPYNRAGQNLYKPDENLVATAKFLEAKLAGIAGVAGPKAKVWHAVYAYNQGSADTTKTPAQHRAAGADGATYADRFFTKLGVVAPDLNTD